MYVDFHEYRGVVINIHNNQPVHYKKYNVDEVGFVYYWGATHQRIRGESINASKEVTQAELKRHGPHSVQFRWRSECGASSRSINGSSKGLVCSHISNRPRAFVSETSERQRLSDIEDFFAVNLVPKERVFSRVCGSTIGGGQRLRQVNVFSQL